jgi:hypothetical protein
MEPEEDNVGMMNILGDNVLLTTRDYGNYTITNGGMTVNPYIDNDYHIHNTHSDIPNIKGEMVFPELLFKIIKKKYMGIRSIEIDSYINNSRFTFYDSVPSYLVFLNVKYHWDAKDVVPPEKLSEYINTSFSMMHTDNDFVKFQIKRVNIEKRDYEKEFFDMFMKK